MSSIIDNGTEFEFYNGAELVKSIDKNLLSIRTDGLNKIEFMESGVVVWYVYYNEMTSPASTGIMDLMSVLSGYLGFPFKSDLTSLFKTRTDLALPNSIVGGGDASVLGAKVGVFTGTEYIDVSHNYNGSSGFRIDFYAKIAQTGPNRIAIGTDSGGSYFSFDTTGALKCQVSHVGSLNLLITQAYTHNNLWHKYSMVYSNSGTVQVLTLYVDDIQIATNTSSFATATLFNIIYIGAYTGLSLKFIGSLSNVNINSVGVYYLNGHVYNSETGALVTNHGVTFAMDKTATLQPAFDYGYVDKSGLQIINYALNTSAVATYDKIYLGEKLHNLFNSYVRFAVGSHMDRDNATIWGATARTGFYDSLNTRDWHITELNQYTIGPMANIGYRGIFFNFFNNNSIDDRNFAKQFLIYATDKTFENEIKVLKYTKDITKAIPDGLGSYTVDANGYVILTN